MKYEKLNLPWFPIFLNDFPELLKITTQLNFTILFRLNGLEQTFLGIPLSSWRTLHSSYWVPFPYNLYIWTINPSHTVVAHKNSFYLFSGTDDLLKQNDLYEFNQGIFYLSLTILLTRLETLTWAKVKVLGDPPAPRSGAQSIVYKDCIYVFGGNAKKVSEYYNDLYRLDLATKKW